MTVKITISLPDRAARRLISNLDEFNEWMEEFVGVEFESIEVEDSDSDDDYLLEPIVEKIKNGVSVNEK